MPQVLSAWAQRIQEFKEQIKMPKRKESMQEAPPRGIENMQNVSPYNTESH